MGLPARTEDHDVDELRERLSALSPARQARVLEGVLTPALRMRVLAEQIRRQAGPISDEAEAEREVDQVVKEVRENQTRGR